jgi:hypothetical protein
LLKWCYHITIASYCSMSAIDFYCSVDKVEGADGKDRVVVTFDGKYLPYTEQVRVFFLFSQLPLCYLLAHGAELHLLASHIIPNI